MDPTSNLKEQLEIAERVLSPEDDPPRRDDFVRLAELVLALNEWMTKGGFKPAQWCLHDGKKP